jgi:hypothetical protein
VNADFVTRIHGKLTTCGGPALERQLVHKRNRIRPGDRMQILLARNKARTMQRDAGYSRRCPPRCIFVHRSSLPRVVGLQIYSIRIESYFTATGVSVASMVPRDSVSSLT